MTIDNEDRNNLIRHRLDEASESIEDVRLLIEHDRLRSAVNRIYYGMFYSLLALALANNFETSKHAQLIGWFNKNFIHPGLIEPKFGKIINKAYNRRTKGDYDIFFEFEKGVIAEMFEEMQDFIKKINEVINVS